MTIRQTLQKYKDIEIDLLLAHVLKQPKEFLYLNPQVTLTPQQTAKLATLVGRRKNSEPIAYLVGHKYFYGLKFKINKHVLTPRPETEWLVERAIQGLRAKGIGSSNTTKNSSLKLKAHLSFLDVGTGSGCIAVSMAHALTTHDSQLTTSVTASDVSSAALKVAAQNAKTHKTDIQFIQSDLFSKIRGTFDIITANLPYVPQGMYELLYHNLQYEPKVAITDGGEVWDMYRRFFEQLPKHLATGGVALLEIDDGSKSDLQKMIKRLLPGYKTSFYKDLNGLWRYLEIKS